MVKQWSEEGAKRWQEFSLAEPDAVAKCRQAPPVGTNQGLPWLG